MGFFSRLFRGSTPSKPAPRADDAAADVHPDLARALAALQAGRHEQAHALAVAALHAGPDAQRICALALSALHRYPDAFPHWLALFQVEPSAHNALQLATVSVMCDEIDRGEAWLMKFDQLNEEQHAMSPAQARTNFLSALDQAGHGDRAMPHLQWLRDSYSMLGTTDSQLLWMRGMPFYPEFLQRSLPMLRLHLPDAQIVDWYQQGREQLDADGQATLDAHLAKLAA